MSSARNRQRRNWTPITGEYKTLDPGIKRAVMILAENGVETFESCDGGRGHSLREPTVRFHGTHAEGFRALSIALHHGLKIDKLRRYWSVEEGEPVGPYWEMTLTL